MKKYVAFCLAVVLLLCFSRHSLAHKVSVSAFMDGDAIQVECSFTKTRKAGGGKVLVSDLETGVVLLDGRTDKRGIFRFQPDPVFLNTGHGLNIAVTTVDGHHAQRKMSGNELKRLTPSVQAALPASQEAAPEKEAALPPAANQTTPVPLVSSLSTTELESLIGKVVDERMAPVTQALARQEDRGPDLRDILGGIGWIIGLLGLAAYMKNRR